MTTICIAGTAAHGKAEAAGSINSVSGSTIGIVDIAATTSGSSVTIAAVINDVCVTVPCGQTGAGGAVAYRTIDGDIPVATSSARAV